MSSLMKHHKFSHNHNHTPASTARPTAAADANGDRVGFTPSPDEVARRAYFTFVNQGSLPGHDVQHWLEAEKQLLDERNLTRIHAFHNRT